MKQKVVISLGSTVAQLSELDVTDINGEKVMMNLEKGQYFALNDVGSRIWDLIEEPKTIEDIVNILLGEYDIEMEVCKKEVMKFIEAMDEAEIIKVS